MKGIRTNVYEPNKLPGGYRHDLTVNLMLRLA